jgi:hypothetical protein
MLTKKPIFVVALIMLTFAVALSACGPSATPTVAAEAMAPLPTVEPVPASAGQPTATAITDTYIRTGPGTNYPAYAIAPAGKSGQVLGKSGDGQ